MCIFITACTVTCGVLLTAFNLDQLERRSRVQAACLCGCCVFPACIGLCGVCEYGYVSICSLHKTLLRLLGMTAEPRCWLEMGTQSAASLHLSGCGVWQLLRENSSLSKQNPFLIKERKSLCARIYYCQAGLNLLLVDGGLFIYPLTFLSNP